MQSNSKHSHHTSFKFDISTIEFFFCAPLTHSLHFGPQFLFFLEKIESWLKHSDKFFKVNHCVGMVIIVFEHLSATHFLSGVEVTSPGFKIQMNQIREGTQHLCSPKKTSQILKCSIFICDDQLPIPYMSILLISTFFCTFFKY